MTGMTRYLVRIAIAALALTGMACTAVDDEVTIADGDLVECRYLGEGLYYGQYASADGDETGRRIFAADHPEAQGAIPSPPGPADLAVADANPWDERSRQVLVSAGADPELAVTHVDHIKDPREMAAAQDGVERRLRGMPSCMPDGEA